MIGEALAMGRRQAELLMRDTWVITRAGESALNPTTLQRETTEVTVYSGPGRLKLGGIQARTRSAGDQVYVRLIAELSLPVGTSAGVQTDDKATCTACPDDPGMVGTVVWIEANPTRTSATAHRFPVRESQ